MVLEFLSPKIRITFTSYVILSLVLSGAKEQAKNLYFVGRDLSVAKNASSE